MDHAALVELITERVIQELLKGGDGVAPAAHNPSGEGRAGRPVLVAPAPGARAEGPVWEALRSLQGIRWIGVAWPGYPEERLRQALGQVEVVSAPFHWEALVTSAEAVVLPFLPLHTLARLALLLTTVPPVCAAVEGIIQGVPVLAGAEEVDRFTRHAARLPGGFLGVVQGHRRTVEGMGVQILEGAALASALQKGAPRPAGSVARGRDVVTHEDVLALVRAGARVLEVGHGSIVTSLAQETAARHGIEVRIR